MKKLLLRVKCACSEINFKDKFTKHQYTLVAFFNLKFLHGGRYLHLNEVVGVLSCLLHVFLSIHVLPSLFQLDDKQEIKK